jgi:hypothetical protein
MREDTHHGTWNRKDHMVERYRHIYQALGDAMADYPNLPDELREDARIVLNGLRSARSSVENIIESLTREEVSLCERTP